MIKKIFKFISLFALISIFTVGTVSVSAQTCTNSDLASAETVETVQPRFNIVCPACGAIGYPTGKIVYIPLSIDEPSQQMRFMSLYQEMKCSKDPSHIWYEYLSEATQ